jgi:hypothetical protein
MEEQGNRKKKLQLEKVMLMNTKDINKQDTKTKLRNIM